MDLPTVLKLCVPTSLAAMVFALGLRATFADATFLFRTALRSPYRLAKSVVAMNVVVPAVAVAIAMAFDLPGSVRIALLVTAVSPVPPILPAKLLKFGGDARFVYGLLVAVSLAAIVVVPTSVEILGRIFGQDVHIGAAVVARAIGISILAPLTAGLCVQWLAPEAAARMAPWLSRIATILLVAGIVPILLASWPAVLTLLGSGAVVAFAVLATAAVATGYCLGGPAPGDRTVLAIACALRHPGIALAIVRVNFPDDQLAPAAILLFLIVAGVATTLYGVLRGRGQPVDAAI